MGGHSGSDAGLAVAHGTTRGEVLAAGDGIAGRFGGRWRGNGDGGSRGHEYRAEGAGRCFHRHPHKLTLKNCTNLPEPSMSGLRAQRRDILFGQRSEERRVGKGGVSKCRSRWSQYNKKKKK